MCPDTFQMTQPRQWAGGHLRHGVLTSAKIQLFSLLTLPLHLFSISPFLMLSCLCSSVWASSHLFSFLFTTFPPLLLSSTVIPGLAQMRSLGFGQGCLPAKKCELTFRHKLEFNWGTRLKKACGPSNFHICCMHNTCMLISCICQPHIPYNLLHPLYATWLFFLHLAVISTFSLVMGGVYDLQFPSASRILDVLITVQILYFPFLPWLHFYVWLLPKFILLADSFLYPTVAQKTVPMFGL